jgi:ABC-2 type transport system permease protein
MSAAWRRFAEELRLLRREGVAAWALAGLWLLLVAAALNGRALLAAQDAASAQLDGEAATLVEALAAQAGRGVPAAQDPGSVGFSVLTRPVSLPQAPLAPLAIGQGDLLPARYELTARGAHHFLARAELDSPLRLAIGNFDAAFVIVWLLPLLAIGLSYGIVSGERERGVLALAVAAGASPSRFVLGKWWSRVVLVVGCIWLATLFAGAVGGVLARPGAGLLLFFWAGISTLYALFWFVLALWLNAGPGSSERNAMALIGVWLVFVILAPAMTNLAATTLFAAPSRVNLTTELREATEAADREAAAARDRYFFDHPEMQAGEMDTRAYFASVARSEASIAREMLPLLQAFDAQSLRQQRLVALLQYCSPGTLAYQALTTLAGSDGARHREFRAQVLSFHGDWTRFFVARLENGRTLATGDYARLPRFAFAEPAQAQMLRQILLPLLALAAVAAAFYVAALRRLRRLAPVS